MTTSQQDSEGIGPPACQLEDKLFRTDSVSIYSSIVVVSRPSRKECCSVLRLLKLTLYEEDGSSKLWKKWLGFWDEVTKMAVICASLKVIFGECEG